MVKTKNKYYNPNPLKKETGDCVIRALCKATGKDWDTVFSELIDIAMEFKELPNSDNVWKTYLINNGFIQHKVSNKKGSKRPTVDSFARSNKSGVFVLRVANHVVTCDNGYYYDLWDSGHCAVYGYWEKPENI